MTKKIVAEFEECKVFRAFLELGNLENYKSRFLALKNHERETSQILKVEGAYGSSGVEVVIDIEDLLLSYTEEEATKKCRDFLEQFCDEILYPEIITAYVCDASACFDWELREYYFINY